MNILDLKEIYSQKKYDFLQRLFGGDVVVYEKLDGNSFGFYKKGDKLIYFKKNEKQEITKLDRVVSTLYDNAIGYIDNISIDVFDMLPEDTKFGFEYFPTVKPVNVEYERLPKNGLVLSYIEKGNSKIEDITSLNYWADTLNVERTAIIFNGLLTEEQKSKILDYLYSGQKEYPNNSFIVNIINILNPKLKKTTLNDNLEKLIEGIIFKFKVDGVNYYAKLLEPIYKEDITTVKSNNEKEDYNYYIILYSILEWIRLNGLKKYTVISSDYDSMYLDLMCDVFNDFCEEKGHQFLDIDFSLPEYLKPYQYKINKNYITNKQTLEWINKSENYIELFKILITSFRKKRKRNNYIFDDNLNLYFNQVVDSIKDKLSMNINESFVTFGQFNKIYNLGEDSEDVLGYDLEDFLPIYKESVDYKKELDIDISKYFRHVFVTTKKNEKPNKKKEKDHSEETIILLDIFSPINNRHIEFIKEKSVQYNKKITLVHIEFPFKHNSYNISKNTNRKILDAIKNEYSALIKDVVYVDDYLLKDIIPKVSESSIVKGMIASVPFLSIVSKQLENNKIKNNYLEIDNLKNFILDKYDDDISLKKKINTCIVGNDFNAFKLKVPQVVSNMFNQIQSDCNSNLLH